MGTDYSVEIAKIKRETRVAVAQINASVANKSDNALAAGFQAQLSAMQQQNMAAMAALQRQRDLAEKEAKAKQEKLKKKIEEKNKEHQNLLKSKDIEHLEEQLKNLISSRKNYGQILIQNFKICVEKQKNFIRKDKEVENESLHLEKLFPVEKDPSVLRVVLYGESGHGKSTCGNRICGDTSPCGNQGPFNASFAAHSVTDEITKYVVKDTYKTAAGKPLIISVVDQPGIFDSKYRDRQFAIELVKYLQGITFINCFVLVKTWSPGRFTGPFQDMIRDLNRNLGPNVWKSMVLVLTHFTPRPEEDIQKRFVEIREFLAEILDHKVDVSSLRILPIDLMENWETKVDTFVTKILPAIPPFICEDLISPIDDLKNERAAAETEFIKVKQDFENILEKDQVAASHIESLQDRLHVLNGNYVIDATLHEGREFDLEAEAEIAKEQVKETSRDTETCSSKKKGSSTITFWKCNTCCTQNAESSACCSGCWTPK